MLRVDLAVLERPASHRGSDFVFVKPEVLLGYVNGAMQLDAVNYLPYKLTLIYSEPHMDHHLQPLPLSLSLNNSAARPWIGVSRATK
jgi:hypothetical protein